MLEGQTSATFTHKTSRKWTNKQQTMRKQNITSFQRLTPSKRPAKIMSSSWSTTRSALEPTIDLPLGKAGRSSIYNEAYLPPPSSSFCRVFLGKRTHRPSFPFLVTNSSSLKMFIANWNGQLVGSEEKTQYKNNTSKLYYEFFPKLLKADAVQPSNQCRP